MAEGSAYCRLLYHTPRPPHLNHCRLHHRSIAAGLLFTQCRCISQYFANVPGFSLRRLLPSTGTVVAAVAVGLLAAASGNVLMSSTALAAHGFTRQAVAHVALGMLLLAVLVGRLVVNEGDTVRALKQLRAPGTKVD